MTEHKQACVEDDEVMIFLKHFRLEQYCKNLMDYGLNSLDDWIHLKDMSEDEIARMATEDLRIKKKSHVKRFVKACTALKNGEYIPVTKDDLKSSKYHKLGSLAVAVRDEFGFDNKIINESQIAIDMQKKILCIWRY